MATLSADVLDLSIPAYFWECSENPAAETLIIALTSHGGCGIHFEFFKPLQQYAKAHVLFLSSVYHNSWYIDGGLSEKYPSLVDVMQNIINPIIADRGITKVITLGEGAGGTGAILYGWEIALNTPTSIIAFAPYNHTSAANWNVHRDICVPVPSDGLKKGSFKIYYDPSHTAETDRCSPLFPDMDEVIQIEGAQHLAKSAYARGDLFRYLDAELAVADQRDKEYTAIYSDLYNSDRLVCHREEIENGTCADIVTA